MPATRGWWWRPNGGEPAASGEVAGAGAPGPMTVRSTPASRVRRGTAMCPNARHPVRATVGRSTAYRQPKVARPGHHPP
ncbi:MAG: hypothetical protein ACRDYY_13660, partial [Acidimicrobiales bacterium]